MMGIATIPLDQNKLNVSTKTRANIFSWRGQFTPEFVEYIIDTFGRVTSTTFDPFCGSGTVLLESARRGLKSIGFEINPAAYAMARFISLSTLSIQERKCLCNALRKRIESLIGTYYDMPLFSSKPAFRETYSNLIHFAGDLLPKIECRDEMVVALVCLFHAENGGKSDLVSAIARALSIVEKKLYELPYASKPMTADLCDARIAHKYLEDSVDLIITSPPYINVFNYHQNYRSIMEVLGFDILKVAASEIGSNRRNRGNRFITVVQYALDMGEAISSFARCLKENGILVLVVGRESRVRGVPFSNSAMLLELADEVGSYDQIAASERVFVNRFGKNIKEDILVLKKKNGRPQAHNAKEIAT
jgi:DNA modification methylase